MKHFFAPMLLLFLLVVAPAVITAQDDVIEIDFVHIFSDDLRPQVIQSIIDDFEAQNPNVIVNAYSTNADSDYEEVFLSALDNADLGEAPNVVQVEERLTQQAIDFGYFVPISDIATDEQLATLEDVQPSILSFYQIDGQLWGMPWNASNPILYYNQNTFDAAGLDPEHPPRTFDDVLAACEAIMAANPDLAACINWPMATWFAEQWMAMQGALIVNNDNGRSGRATETFYDSPEMSRILSWWDELDANGYYTYTGRVGDDNGEGIAFLTGRTAMHINSSAGLTLIQNFAQFDLGVGPLPRPDEEATNGVTVGGASLWIMADQTEEEMRVSADFIFFLTDTANDIRWHQGTGYVPIRVSSNEQLREEGYYEENPYFSVAVNQLADTSLNNASAGAVVGPAQLVRGHLITAFQVIVNDEDDSDEAIQAALDNAKTRADEELQEYNEAYAE